MAPAGQTFSSPSSCPSSLPATSYRGHGWSSILIPGELCWGEGEKKRRRGSLGWTTDQTLPQIALLGPSWSCWEGHRHTEAPSPWNEIRSRAPGHVNPAAEAHTLWFSTQLDTMLLGLCPHLLTSLGSLAHCGPGERGRPPPDAPHTWQESWRNQGPGLQPVHPSMSQPSLESGLPLRPSLLGRRN